MRVKDVSNMELFYHNCQCGHMNIHGFWHQLKTEVLPNRKYVRVKMPCEKCDKIYLKHFRLTTGRGLRHRLTDWIGWFGRICKWIPDRLLYPAVGWVRWLEARVPL